MQEKRCSYEVLLEDQFLKTKVRILLVEGESYFPVLRLLRVSRVEFEINPQNTCTGSEGN